MKWLDIIYNTEMCSLSSYIVCTIVNGYGLHQAAVQWLKSILFVVVSDSNHYPGIWYISLFLRHNHHLLKSKQISLRHLSFSFCSILYITDAIYNCCRGLVYKKLFYAKWESISECSSYYVCRKMLFCLTAFCIKQLLERKGPGKILTFYQGGEQKLLHYG